MVLARALAASLSVRAAFETRPATEANIAKAADREVEVENGYSVLVGALVRGTKRKSRFLIKR